MATLTKFNLKYLKKNGIDAEEVKKEYVGKFGGRYDLFDGPTITIRSKDGRDVIDTELTREQFFNVFGIEKERGE